MLNPVLQWMLAPAGVQTVYVVNSNMYVVPAVYQGGVYVSAPGVVMQVQMYDAPALEALGWQVATPPAPVRLKAPPEVTSAAVGTNGYQVGTDGTILASAYDVPLLIAAGFKVAS